MKGINKIFKIEHIGEEIDIDYLGAGVGATIISLQKGRIFGFIPTITQKIYNQSCIPKNIKTLAKSSFIFGTKPYQLSKKQLEDMIENAKTKSL